MGNYTLKIPNLKHIFKGQYSWVKESRYGRKFIWLQSSEIFAYEVPLEHSNRGRSVDLMGYDKDFNLYLIELKKKNSTEKMGRVINQLNEYEKLVQNIILSLEQEFEKEFFYPIHFKAIKKMVIAPREFFKGKNHLLEDDTIEYGHFRDIDITDRQPKQRINIHLQR